MNLIGHYKFQTGKVQKWFFTSSEIYTQREMNSARGLLKHIGTASPSRRLYSILNQGHVTAPLNFINGTRVDPKNPKKEDSFDLQYPATG